MSEGKLKFGIAVDKICDGGWSFGIGLSHDPKQTYLYINLIKWTLCIGRIMYFLEDDDD